MAADLELQVVEVASKTTLTTAKAIWNALATLVANRNKTTHGKQSMRKLNLQGRKLESVPATGDDIHKLRKMLKQYSVDFSVMRDRQNDTYSVFFKAQDADRVAYAAERVMSAKGNDLDKNEDKPPLDKQVDNAKQAAAQRNAQRQATQEWSRDRSKGDR